MSLISTKQLYAQAPLWVVSNPYAASWPSLITGFYFNGLSRIATVVCNTKQVPNGWDTKTVQSWGLQISNVNVELSSDGSYSVAIEQTDVGGTLNGTSYDGPVFSHNTTAITSQIIGDDMHLFIVLPGQTQISCYTLTAGTGTDVVLTANSILQLPNPISSLSATTIPGSQSLNLIYTSPDTENKLCYTVFDGTSIGDVVFVPLNNGPAYPISSLSVAEMDTASTTGQDHQLSFVDSNNQAWTTTLINGTPTVDMELVPISPAFDTAPVLASIAPGPFATLQQTQSMAMFYTSNDNKFNYAQIPISELGSMPEILPFPEPKPGGGIVCSFATQGYVPFAGDDEQQNFFRFNIYGYSQIGDDGAYTGFQVYAFASGQLKSEPIISTATENPTPEQLKMYQSAWSLLGIIHGPPPFPNNLDTQPPENLSEAQISFTLTAGSSNSITYDQSATAGFDYNGLIFSASASITHAISTDSTTSKTCAISVSQTLSNANLQNQGILLFSQPTISNKPYRLYGSDGTTDLQFVLHLLSVSESLIAPVIYDITDPNSGNLPCCVNLAELPPSSSVQASDGPNWSSILVPQNQGTPHLVLQPVSSDAAGGGSETISESTTQQFTNSSTNTVEASAGAFGFSTSLSGSWGLSSSASTSFQTNFSFSINTLATHEPISVDDVVQIEVQPHIIQLESTAAIAAKLIPSLYPNSNPWLITWKVLFTKTGADLASEND